MSINSKTDSGFFNFSAAMLLLTALAKLYSSGGSARVLQAQDQLLHLGYRPLMIMVGPLEVGVGAFLLASRSNLRRSLVLFRLTTNFIIYRLGNYLLGIHSCPCLGQLTDHLPMPKGLADVILQVLLLYWLLGSLGVFWQVWASERWVRIVFGLPWDFSERLGH